MGITDGFVGLGSGGGKAHLSEDLCQLCQSFGDASVSLAQELFLEDVVGLSPGDLPAVQQEEVVKMGEGGEPVVVDNEDQCATSCFLLEYLEDDFFGAHVNACGGFV